MNEKSPHRHRRLVSTETACSSLDDASGIACVRSVCLVENHLAEARSDFTVTNPE